MTPLAVLLVSGIILCAAPGILPIAISAVAGVMNAADYRFGDCMGVAFP
jgi:hypothetical protein